MDTSSCHLPNTALDSGATDGAVETQQGAPHPALYSQAALAESVLAQATMPKLLLILPLLLLLSLVLETEFSA